MYANALTGEIVRPFLRQRALGEWNGSAPNLNSAAAQIEFATCAKVQEA